MSSRFTSCSAFAGAVLACGLSVSAGAAVFYVAPDGKTPEQGGDGTLARPYDLPSALVAEGSSDGEFRLLMSDSPYLLTASINPHRKTFRGWNGATDAPAGKEGRDKVVLDGQGTVCCVNSTNGSGSWTFADLTICNGDSKETGCLIYGKNVTGASLVTNCVLRSATCANRAVEFNTHPSGSAHRLHFVDCDFRDLTVTGTQGFVTAEGDGAAFKRCNFFNNNQTGPSNSYGSFGYGSAAFTDCVISNNTGVGIGGFCMSRSTWTRCHFENNRNTNCGACLYVLESGTCAVTDCVFTNNACPNTAGSGGACLAGGYISGKSSSGYWYVTNTVFVGNHSDASGGVMSLRNAAGSTVEFVACAFSNNVSGACLNAANRSVAGSTLWLSGITELHLDRCVFVDNMTAGISAAVSARANPSKASCVLTNGFIRNSLFLRNRSTGSNGGSLEGSVGLDGTCFVDGCTFVGNATDKNLVGGLAVGGSDTDGPTKMVSNCLFYDNARYGGVKTDRHAACNAVPAGDVRYWNCFSQYGFLPEGQGNVNGTASAPIDPLFVDLAADDYRLQERSPCVDAGENKAWMNGAKDLLGLRRPRRIEGGVVDIGCYECRVFPGLLWLLK